MSAGGHACPVALERADRPAFAPLPALTGPGVKAWAAGLFASARLPDRRLARRAQTIAAAFAARPADSIPQAFDDWAGTKGAYRFIENQRVTCQAIESSVAQGAARACVAYDAVLAVIGFQTHMWEHGQWPLEEVWGVAERFARYGKPLFFTELTFHSAETRTMPPGVNVKDFVTSSTPAGEARQADYAVNLYRLLFSHPVAEGITWWDFCDFKAWGAPNGLLRADMTPKPAYERLLALIKKEWWTRADGTTDENGEFRFRGFYGDYLVTAVPASDAMVSRDFTLRQ